MTGQAIHALAKCHLAGRVLRSRAALLVALWLAGIVAVGGVAYFLRAMIRLASGGF